MPSVWEQRFAQFVKHVCGLRESTSLEVLPDLMPVLDVFAPQGEHAFSRGDMRVSGAVTQAAGVGLFSRLWLTNNTEGLLITVDEVLISASANGTILAHLTTTSPGGAPVGTVAPTDTRWSRGSANAPALGRLSSDQNVGAPGGVLVMQVELNTITSPWVVSQPVVLRPNWSLVFLPATQNTALTATFTWRERSPSSERGAPT